MTNSDICNIIKQCGRSGVLHLSYEGLTIQFNSDRKLELPKAHIVKEEPLPQKLELTDEQKAELKEWDRMNLFLDDPVAAEDEMLEDDIEGARLERVEDRGIEPDVHERGGRGS